MNNNHSLNFATLRPGRHCLLHPPRVVIILLKTCRRQPQSKLFYWHLVLLILDSYVAREQNFFSSASRKIFNVVASFRQVPSMCFWSWEEVPLRFVFFRANKVPLKEKKQCWLRNKFPKWELSHFCWSSSGSENEDDKVDARMTLVP